MTKSYLSPELVELGAIEELTSALGASARPDFSAFPSQVPAGLGSFDVCPNGNPGQC